MSAEIDRLEATLSQLLNTFVPPAQIDVVGPQGEIIAVDLSEADSAVKVWPSGMAFPVDIPTLPHTANNTPIHAFTDQLSRLLEELDGVNTRNDEKIKMRRKDVVRVVVEELDNTDEWMKRILSIYKYGNGGNEPGPSMQVAGGGSFAHYHTQLHPSITHHAQYPSIFFDMSLPPTVENVPIDASAVPDAHPASKVFTAQAVHPPLSAMVLRSDKLPWGIEVRSSEDYDHLLGVSDVLQCIYRSFQLPVTVDELAALDAGRSFHVQAAYRARCNRCQTPKEYEEEKQVGVRRIDFLMGRHMFGGLSADSRNGSGAWILHIL
ncbi:hypothetical protein NEOLEDRAFT_394417 [Neolentinus lepideus HHB14362 ss-1]|uniref:Uncharacterized protein n=1 Tax=Neolentinus lepideus HHB14362 ss-1 TaxID=1314782 RepID=A0A165S8C1_9AGAM|nr:hypothetical protein NEOLEDRAFT_394417 [Neolentinus lepideus HHB14362 ss-1]